MQDRLTLGHDGTPTLGPSKFRRLQVLEATAITLIKHRRAVSHPYEIQINLVVMHVVVNVLSSIVRLWMNCRLSEMCGGHSPDGGRQSVGHSDRGGSE